MKLTCLVILASITVFNVTVCGGQGPPEDETTRDRKTIDDIILQRAESLLLRSILKKIENDDGSNEGISSQPEWVEKRQHPGKRYYSQDLEKRQHPGRREEEDADDDEEFQDVQRRQHPGKREEDENMDSFLEQLDKRQHPGKRVVPAAALLDEVVSENPIGELLIGELSKRQHPGKKRDYYEDETEGGWDESDRQEALEKRQHPGKRFSDNTVTIPDDLGTNNDSPCNALDPVKCGQANLLLHLLHNFAMMHDQGRAEEKRQHPGKRSAPEEDLVVPE